MKCSHGIPYEVPCYKCLQEGLAQNELTYKQDDIRKQLRDLERRVLVLEVEVAKAKRGG